METGLGDGSCHTTHPCHHGSHPCPPWAALQDPGRSSLAHLLLLPHDLQLLCQLDLALPLCLLRCTAQLLLVLLPQRVQGPARVPDLGQLVLQALIVHWGGKGQPQEQGAERLGCPCTAQQPLSSETVPREC